MKQMDNLHNTKHWCWHNPFSYLAYLIYATILLFIRGVYVEARDWKKKK